MGHDHDDSTQPKWDLAERLLQFSAASVNLTERIEPRATQETTLADGCQVKQRGMALR